MKLGWIVGAVILLVPVPARSAPAPRPRPRPAAPARETGTDVSASYSHLSAGEAGLNGADVSASFPFRRAWRLAADLSVHSGSFAGADLTQTTLMGGLRRVVRPGRRWQPFGQALLGGSRASSSFASVDGSLHSSQTSWGGALGVGVDYRLTPRWAVRGQGDYLLLHSSAGWDADPRLSVGVAYRFAH
jgi:opacity protein-like surface antigen